MMRIRNWARFQHFKDRRPPWIKLYRDILDQRDIALISDRAFRVLVSLWLLASEDDEGKGRLPDIPDIAFRLRMPEQSITKALGELEPFLDVDDDTAISLWHRGDAPETETERETKTEKETDGDFNSFWAAYPKKVGKEPARKAFARAARASDWPGVSALIDAVRRQSVGWSDKQFIPNPATWLNGKRWGDEVIKSAVKPQDNVRPAVRETYVEPDRTPATREELAEIDRQIAEARMKSPALRKYVGGEE